MLVVLCSPRERRWVGVALTLALLVVVLSARAEVGVEDFLLLRDAFIVNFVTSSTNTEVATWGPRRVAGLIAQMQAHLAGDTYPGTLTS